MPRLVVSPRNTTDAQRLEAAAAARGWEVQRFSSWRLPPDWTAPDDLAIYGEPLFARVVAAQCGHVLLEPPHDWLVGLPEWATRRRISMVPFSDLSQVALPRFLKPPDDKLFRAAVYDDITELAARDDIDPDQEVLFSDPVTFEREFRVHVLRGAAVSCSRYCIGEASAETREDPQCEAAAALATKVAEAATGTTPTALVVDIGRLDNGTLAVVEANPVFGAGIYAGEPDAILDVLLEACQPQAGLDPKLAPFIFPVELE